MNLRFFGGRRVLSMSGVNLVIDTDLLAPQQQTMVIMQQPGYIQQQQPQPMYIQQPNGQLVMVQPSNDAYEKGIFV